VDEKEGTYLWYDPERYIPTAQRKIAREPSRSRTSSFLMSSGTKRSTKT